MPTPNNSEVFENEDDDDVGSEDNFILHNEEIGAEISGTASCKHL